MKAGVFGPPRKKRVTAMRGSSVMGGFIDACRKLLPVFFLLVISTTRSLGALAQEKNITLEDQVYEESFKAIFLLFVLAVILESALALVFNWRPFVENLNSRAVRPLVAFIVALFFVWWFDLDIATALVNATTDANHAPSVPGEVLTALILAGGSSGVNTILIALGYRQRKTPETVVAKPPKDKAWIAVRAIRDKAVGNIDVQVNPVEAGGASSPSVAGIIAPKSKRGLMGFFLSDRDRFPGYGGYEVQADKEYQIALRSQDAEGMQLDTKWGPYKIASGAIIDLELEI
jgi:hypothetical protein